MRRTSNANKNKSIICNYQQSFFNRCYSYSIFLVSCQIILHMGSLHFHSWISSRNKCNRTDVVIYTRTPSTCIQLLSAASISCADRCIHFGWWRRVVHYYNKREVRELSSEERSLSRGEVQVGTVSTYPGHVGAVFTPLTHSLIHIHTHSCSRHLGYQPDSWSSKTLLETGFPV